MKHPEILNIAYLGRGLTRRAVTTLAHFVLLVMTCEASPLYTVTFLGGFTGGFGRGYGINDSGRVVGFGTVVPNGIVVKGFVADTHPLISGSFVPTVSSSTVTAINNSGQAVGGDTNLQGTESQPFIYTESGQLIELGTLGGRFGIANGINSKGVVVGSSTNGVDPAAHPFIWSSSTGFQDITGLNGASYGINSFSWVSGWTCVTAACSSTSAFLYIPGQGIQLLGTLGGNSSIAYAVNDSGIVVGESTTGNFYFYPQESGLIYRAFISNRGPGSTDTSVVDIGTLGGEVSAAYAVNASGVVVGTSQTGQQTNGTPIYHAFIYSNGLMKDLNDLINPGFADQYGPLFEARGINASGQIVANTNNGAFLLTPIGGSGTGGSEVPEPSTLILVGAGILLTGFIRRAKSRT